MTVPSIRDQATNALNYNPFVAEWASTQPSPVSLQPSEGTKTANTGALDSGGVYFDATQKLAQATLMALMHKNNVLAASTSVPAGSEAYTNTSSVNSLTQRQSQTIASAKNALGTYTHMPSASASVNNHLNVSAINNLPEFHNFMGQMFETLKNIDQSRSASASIQAVNKNSVTALSMSTNNYYYSGYGQDSYDLLKSQLMYLTKAATAQPTNPSAPNPNSAQKAPITPGQSQPEYAKGIAAQPPVRSDNEITNPNIQKLNESFNSLASSLQGNIGASSLASFMQNLQHQAHGMSASGNLVNTSA